MKKLFYSLLFLFPVVVFAQQPWYKSSLLDYSWQDVGNPGFSSGLASNINLVFSSSGEPYVAYMDYGNSYKACVKKFDGTDWMNVGSPGFSAGIAEYLSLALNATNNQPYVAYSDGANSEKATVMTFDGTNWVDVGNAGFSPGTAGWLSIAFSQSGVPYVAYIDVYYTGKPIVMKFDGTNWVYVGSEGFSAGNAGSTSIAFNSSGQPNVAFQDSTNSYKTKVMYYNAPAGISEPESSQISIYPNPATDKLILKTSVTSTSSHLSIMNLNGQELIVQPITEPKTQIDISNLPRGVYFVRLTNNKTVEVRKIIKE
jgi:hypothetical protein